MQIVPWMARGMSRSRDTFHVAPFQRLRCALLQCFQLCHCYFKLCQTQRSWRQLRRLEGFLHCRRNEGMSPKKGLFSIGNTSETNLHFLGVQKVNFPKVFLFNISAHIYAARFLLLRDVWPCQRQAWKPR